LKRAQAIGDREALLKHKRKVITVDLGEDYITGLQIFKRLIEDIHQPVPDEVKPAAFVMNMKKFRKVFPEQEKKSVFTDYESENNLAVKEKLDNSPI
jgi:hypothetical protein